MARRIARPIHLAVAWLLVAGLLVQVFLAGMGVFDSSSMFATHRDFGYTADAASGRAGRDVAGGSGSAGWRRSPRP